MDQQEPQLSNVAAQPAVLRATIHITRKATGQTETYELVGTPEVPQVEQKESE